MSTAKAIPKEEFRSSAKAKVEALLLSRKDNGCLESEADFLAGAMVVIGLVNELLYDSTEELSMSIVPPIWFIAPMTGRSVLKEMK